MIDAEIKKRLASFATKLIDQDAAEIIVPPSAAKPGYWFGGGNLSEGPDGHVYLCGRYRDAGDSRTGLSAGPRGNQLAIFRSTDNSREFEKVLSFSKDRLSPGKGGEILSIEGTALRFDADGAVELFVSTEKSDRNYPPGLESYKKPGTGVWSIDVMRASMPEALNDADVHPLLSTDDPSHIHIKDPVVHDNPDGTTVLAFCSLPFGWSSSNSGWCVREPGSEGFGPMQFEVLPRGAAWDVAAARITDFLDLPASWLGGNAALTLVFYDGAECLREHAENAKAVMRPRGYSCEELGGLAVAASPVPGPMERISVLFPLFVSPGGTGTSRYVQTLVTKDRVFAAWQQGRPDGSQPLVMHSLDTDHAQELLRG